MADNRWSAVNGGGNGNGSGNGHSNGHGPGPGRGHAEPVIRYTLDDYYLAVYRRKWLVLFIVACTVGLTWFFSTRIQPRYEAESVFYVPQDVPGYSPGPEAGAARLPTGMMGQARAYATLLESADAVRHIAGLFPGRKASDLYRDVDLVVAREGVIRVYARDADPQRAADIANAYADYFNTFHLGLIKEDLGQTIQNMEEKLRQVDQEYARMQLELQRYREQHHIASLPAQLEELESKRARLAYMKHLAQIDLDVARNRTKAMQVEYGREEQGYLDGELLLDSPVIQSMQQTMAELEIEIAGRLVDVREQHPDIVALRRRYDTAKQNLGDHIQRLMDSRSKVPGSLYDELRTSLVRAQIQQQAETARVAAIEQALGGVMAQIAAAPAMMTQTLRLEDGLKQRHEFLGNLRATRQGLVTQMLSLTDTTVVIQTAHAPTTPVFPIIPLNMMVAALAGVMFGVLYALFLDHLSTRRRLARLRQVEMSQWLAALSNPQPKREARHDAVHTI